MTDHTCDICNKPIVTGQGVYRGMNRHYDCHIDKHGAPTNEEIAQAVKDTINRIAPPPPGRIDLANATPDDIRNFVVAVTGLACHDYYNGAEPGKKTGREIVNKFCRSWRGFHLNMATTIYNKTILSLQFCGKD